MPSASGGQHRQADRQTDDVEASPRCRSVYADDKINYIIIKCKSTTC